MRLFLWMSYMVFVQGLSNYSLGHLSRDISGSPNSPFTMGNSYLTNVPALPAQPTMPSRQAFEQEPNSGPPEVSSNLTDPNDLVLPPTQPLLVIICRHIKEAFCRNAHICVYMLSTLLINHFSNLQRCSQSIRRLPNALQN